MAKRILKKVFKGGNEYEVGNIKVYSITESDVSVATDSTMGISPYNTYYGYTGITINESTGIKWKEGAIYCFVVNTSMVVSSTYKNVRVRIGSSGSRIPVFGNSSILNGDSYFKKAQQRLFVYKTTYQSTGALHMITDTDTNTYYSNITKSEIQTGTATTQRTVSASVIKESLPTISSDSNNILGYAKIRAGNKSDYDAMNSHDANTLYFCIDNGWTPGANTLAYYPLTSSTTTSDMSGNSRNLTNNGATFGTYQGVNCAYLTEAKKYLLTPTLTGSDIKTISVWAYWDGTFYPNTSDFAQLLNYGILNGSTSIYIYNNKDGKLHFENNAGTNYQILTNYISGAWYNLVITIGTDTKMYINGNYIGSCASGTLSNGTFIFGTWIGTPSSTDKYSGGISNWVIENKERTAQEIQAYYNQTKSNYGL